MSSCKVIAVPHTRKFNQWIGALAVLWAACTAPSGPERPISGKQIFARHCARCHGTDGRGTAAYAQSGIQDLSDPMYMNRIGDDQLRQIIRMGKPPKMPGFEGQFIEPSLGVLVAYVHSLAKQPVSSSSNSGDSEDSKKSP